MLKTLNLKEAGGVEIALALVEIEIENAKAAGVSVIKLIHGYGSHGEGGVILRELRRQLLFMKKRGQIEDFFGGDKWNLFDKDVLSLLNFDKSIAGDCDLGRSNPGITIVVLKREKK